VACNRFVYRAGERKVSAMLNNTQNPAVSERLRDRHPAPLMERGLRELATATDDERAWVRSETKGRLQA
jgi:hypothetical protein